MVKPEVEFLAHNRTPMVDVGADSWQSPFKFITHVKHRVDFEFEARSW